MDRQAVEAFLVALFLLSAFVVARARSGKQFLVAHLIEALDPLTVVCDS